MTDNERGPVAATAAPADGQGPGEIDHAGASDPDHPVAGLDVGGTKTLGVVVDAGGAIVASVWRPTAARDKATVEGAIRDTLRDLARQAGVSVDGFAAVGVGIPGLVDRGAGTVRHAVNLGMGDEPLDLARLVGTLADAPVVVDNDVNMAAVGAALALGCTGDLAYLSVGTGVAAGFLLDGRIRHGAHGAAGEIGHLPVDPGGALCECGQRGCLEAVASGTAITRRWPGGDGTPSVAEALLQAASAGDGVAIEVRDEVAGYLAGAIALIAQTVDPEVIVLGGGVADGGQQLLEAVSSALAVRAAHSPVLSALGLSARLALVPEGVPAGALGAARLASRLPPRETTSLHG